jgi:hypothetical protein
VKSLRGKTWASARILPREPCDLSVRRDFDPIGGLDQWPDWVGSRHRSSRTTSQGVKETVSTRDFAAVWALVSYVRSEGCACSEGCKAPSGATTHGVLTTMFPFRGTERRAFQALHGASVFPLSAEGVRRIVPSCVVLPRPASPPGHVSSPSTVGSRLNHGARRGPAVLVGTSDLPNSLVDPSRAGDQSHRNGTGTTTCRDC